MYPHERSLVKQLAGKPFEIVGVNSDDDIESIQQIVKEKNLTWRSFRNNQGASQISSDWGVTGWPTIYLIDAKGVIRFKNVRGANLDKAIETLLSEMGHEVEITHPEPKKDKGKESKKDKEIDKMDG